MKGKLTPGLRRLCYGLGLILTACLITGAMFTLSLAAEGTAQVKVSDTTYDINVGTFPSNAGTASVSYQKAEGGTSAQVTLTATANPGWAFERWEADTGIGNDDISNRNSPSASFNVGSGGYNVTINVTVTAHFVWTGYAINVTPPTEGGTIESDKDTADQGDTVTLTATPTDGYVLQNFTVTKVGGGGVDVTTKSDTTATFTMPASDVTVTANFEKINYNVSVTALENGTVTASKSPANMGDEITLTVTPDTGYALDELTVTDGENSTVTATKVDDDTYTFDMPAADVTVKATFKKINYTVSVTAPENGTVTAPETANYKDTVTLTVKPANGYALQSLAATKADGTAVPVTNNQFTMPASNVTVTATFVKQDYTVTVNVDPTEGGTASASVTDGTPNDNKTVTLTATANPGWEFDSWTVTYGENNTVPVTGNQFTMPPNDVTVTAHFSEIQPKSEPEPEVDDDDDDDDDGVSVLNLDVYRVATGRLRVMPMNLRPQGKLTLNLREEEAGLWGNLYRFPVQKRPAAREQYRNENYEGLELCAVSPIEPGKPTVWPLEYSASYAYAVIIDDRDHTAWVNPFTDVGEDDPYYDAVRYVCENGVMEGTGDGTTFTPEGQVNRAQLLTVLWRLQGSPVVEGTLDFTDVAADAWYEDAVRWAVSVGLATGRGNGLLGPEDPLTRE